jgi:hypothetical protein
VRGRRALLALLGALVMAGCAAFPLPAAPTQPTPPPDSTRVALATPEPSPTADEPAEADQAEEPTPTATPFAPTLVQLTEPGCCAQPFWSADGREVWFIDQPGAGEPTGLYGVDIETGERRLVSEQIGLPSPDGAYRAYLSDEGQTVVEEVESGERYVIPSSGRRVFFSPGSERLAWAEFTPGAGNFDQMEVTIKLANLDGSDDRELITLIGGGIAGWLDDDRLLLVGRVPGSDPDLALFSLSVEDGSRVNLMLNQRIYTVRIAPGGEWVLYTVAFGEGQLAESDGLWVVRTDGTLRFKLETVGSAQWRDESRLLIIPLELDAPSHQLWQFDTETGEALPLIDPAQLSFRVSAGEWAVSPTGEHLVFLSAEDESLWLIDLPPDG